MYFGIGWHKTGTTSLTEAFNLLGMKARHHPYEMYPEYMAGAQRFTAFGDNDFVCDAIIHVIYPELDQNYPDSKFILTTRAAAPWLESVRKHFEKGYAPRADLDGKSWWDYNNATRHVHPIHSMMYGRATFDEETMLARYRAHEEGVREYFKDRPDDLLILDMDTASQNGWQALCDFTSACQPKCDFPHLRKSAESKRYFSFGKPEIPAFIVK